MNDESTLIKGLFLLILAISGNFIAETLGCKTQYLLTNNMYAKHLISLFILFFSISIFDTSYGPPHILLKKTFMIYIIFIMYTKMDITFTIIVFSLLSLVYIITIYEEYYEKNDIEQDKKLLFEKYRTNLYYLIIFGFLLYFRRQYEDHSKNWSTSKFIFGANKCDSLK